MLGVRMADNLSRGVNMRFQGDIDGMRNTYCPGGASHVLDGEAAGYPAKPADSCLARATNRCRNRYMWLQRALPEGLRVVVYGDSWARELYKSIVRIALRNSSSRYLPRMVETEANREHWGRQFSPALLWFARHPIGHSTNAIVRYCFFRGCGPARDYGVCGYPGRDDLGSIAYSAKAYLDSIDWDTNTSRWARQTEAHVMLLDPSCRWGSTPHVCTPNLPVRSEIMSASARTHDFGHRPKTISEANDLQHIRKSACTCADPQVAAFIARMATALPSVYVIALVANSSSCPQRSNLLFLDLRALTTEASVKRCRLRGQLGHGYAGPLLDDWAAFVIALLQVLPWRVGRAQRATTRQASL
jgi:hypothetical protein